MSLTVITEKNQWDHTIHNFSFWDPAHEWGYFQAYRARTIEHDSQPVLLTYTSADSTIAYPFFLKETETGTRKLEAIYGYTGPLTRGPHIDNIWPDFQADLREYCQNNNITTITERFHPVLQNQRPLLPESQLELRRQVVLIHPTQITDLLQSYRRTNTRKAIRISTDKGAIGTRGGVERIDEALRIYDQTMDRNHASGVYYFEREFFEALFHYMPDQCTFFFVEVEGNVAAMSLVLHSPQCAFSFLVGMDTSYREYQPNYLLQHEELIYYKELGIPHINYGGGRTADPGDNLMRFKRGFTKNDPADYYMGYTDLGHELR